jgi:hypothetical protein
MLEDKPMRGLDSGDEEGQLRPMDIQDPLMDLVQVLARAPYYSRTTLPFSRIQHLISTQLAEAEIAYFAVAY